MKKYLTRLITLFVLVTTVFVNAQDFNPPFPRTVFQSPYGTSGGAADFFFAQYDLAIHGLRLEDAQAFNDSIKTWDPNIMIFGTSRQGAWAGSEPSGMMAYCAFTSSLTTSANAGDTDIYCTKINEYEPPTRHKYALVGEDDWIKYTSIDENGIYGILADDYGLNKSHPPGTLIRFPHRMSGFGMLPNLSSLAPMVEGKETWKWFIDGRFSRQDFSLFDGIFYDAFRMQLWLEDLEFQAGIDLDNNYINDLDEFGSWHGAALAEINRKWSEGITSMLEYEHQRFTEANPGVLSIVTTNTGAAEEGYPTDVCEGMLWEGFMRFSTNWESMMIVNRQWDQKAAERGITNFTLIVDYEKESRAEWGKDVFNRMRYGLTTALLSGCFYGRTFGDYYYITFYHDEFDTDLGYPTSEPQELSSGAWVRFFTKGAAICNPTAKVTTVNASELTGMDGFDGPYYRFRGGQDPEFNNGELFSTVELYGETRVRERDNQGDGILLFKDQVTTVADIWIGNTLNNDTSPGNLPVELVGNWIEEMDTDDPWTSRNPCFSQWHGGPNAGSVINDGIGYAYVSGGNGSATATFRPTIGVEGYYEISEWHGWLSTALDYEVPYQLVVNDEIKAVGTFDQKTSEGKWNRLAIVQLPKGTNSYLRINNNTPGPILADGIRFKYIGPGGEDSTSPRAPQNLRIFQP
jgi:hypothetical protein